VTAVAALLDGVLALPASAIAGRAVADPDEDAVTLAAEAALPLVERAPEPPRALVLATVSPPYDEGGSVQALAELLGLAGERLALELTASLRDGLAALRIAGALAAVGDGPVLVAAAHRARSERDAGDGSVALLVGAGGGAASVRAVHARVEEVRDRWRLAGAAEPSEGDPSFVWEHGSARVAAELGLAAPMVVAPNARSAARAERALGGSGDPLVATTGVLGAAHPLARILLSLESGGVVIAAAGGLAEVVEIEPGRGAAELAAAARAVLAAERLREEPPQVDWSALEPYQSAPRAWRERGQDFRLEGARCPACGRLVFPRRPTCPGCGSRELVLERLARTGTVVTETRDHVYPAGEFTGMAAVDLDGGGRFYGQVVPSSRVSIGDRVRLVPRRLHVGGGSAQYFWKVRR
jgi:hydroxymethylglutaryl-CoA synthase